MERGGIASDGLGPEEENTWVELFGPGPDNNDYSECGEDIGQPAQIAVEASMVTARQPQKGVKSPLPPKPSNLKAVRESSGDRSTSRKGK